MKSFRLLLALALACLVSAAFAHAADDKAKTEEKCECPADKDGKVCGKDKDCCCTGKKCEKPAEEKPAEPKK